MRTSASKLTPDSNSPSTRTPIWRRKMRPSLSAAPVPVPTQPAAPWRARLIDAGMNQVDDIARGELVLFETSWPLSKAAI